MGRDHAALAPYRREEGSPNMMVILAMAAAVTASGADDVAAKNKADLQMLYDQSCKVRAYGSYDDMCNKLRKRIKEFERDQARADRDRSRTAAAPPPAAPVETPTTQPAFAARGSN
jgi:hypothetical protein